MISESTLINVFEMVVQRLNALEISIENINKTLLYDARYKTNDIFHGEIFNYPFQIENYKLAKKKYAYVYIKLTERGDFNSLYDILMSIFDFTFIDLKTLTNKQKQTREQLKVFLQKHYSKVLKTLVSISVLNDKHLTTLYHKIDSLHTNLLEHILNHFVNIDTFGTFNHVDNAISILFSSRSESLYVDQIIDSILTELTTRFDYKAQDIENIKIVGLSSKDLYDLVKIYDINSGCCDIDKQRAKVIDYIGKLSDTKRLELRKTLIEQGKERPILPIFADKKETNFICDSLEPDITIIDQPFILIMPGGGANTTAAAALAAAMAS